MELKNEDLTAAWEGKHVKIQANGHTFYLLSQQAYHELENVDYDVMTKEDGLDGRRSGRTHALISDRETDEY